MEAEKQLSYIQLSKSILGSNLAHMLFMITCTTGLCGCYEKTVTMATRDSCNVSAM